MGLMAQISHIQPMMMSLSSKSLYNNRQGPLLPILLTAVAFLWANPGEAALSCTAVFRDLGNYNLTREVIDDSYLLKAASSLRSRAHEIDPVRSHVPELVLPAQQVANQIRIALREKVHEKIYLTRKPMLENVIREIEGRIASNNITYEFSAALPFRVGWLLKMSEKDPYILANPGLYGPFPHIETRYFYEAKTYRTHKNFMATLEKANQFVRGTYMGVQNRPPLLKEIMESLKDFPKIIFIPTFHRLSIPVLNHLMAMKVYPLGNIRSALGESKLDGLFFDESNFPIHDWGHARGSKEDPTQGQLTEKIVGPLERMSLNEVSRQEGRRFEIWHVMHFHIFHESIRYTYSEPSIEGVKTCYREELSSSIGRYLRNGAAVELFPEWLLGLPKEQQEKYINEEMQLYTQMLVRQIDSQRSVIQSELDMIKRVSGQ